MPFKENAPTARTPFCRSRYRLPGRPGHDTPEDVTRIGEVLRRSWLALALGGLAAALLLSALQGERGLARVLQLERELADVNDRNFRLVQEIDRLRHELTMVRTDDATLERVARRHLGMVRPGEVLYRVRPRAAGAAAAASAGPAVRPESEAPRR